MDVIMKKLSTLTEDHTCTDCIYCNRLSCLNEPDTYCDYIDCNARNECLHEHPIKEGYSREDDKRKFKKRCEGVPMA